MMMNASLHVESNTMDFLENLKLLIECPSKKSESVYRKVSYCFEDDLLNFDDMPAEHMNFLLEVLRNEAIYSKTGVWLFLLGMSSESHRLNENDYSKISKCITENFVNYTDEQLCLTACDFIARNYEYNKAKKILLELKKIEEHKEESGFALDGLITLEKEKVRNDAS